MATASFRLMRLNRSTWEDDVEVPFVDSVTISRDCSEDSPLMESGTYTLTAGIGSDFQEGWYRLELLLEEDGSYSRYPIATQLLEATSGRIDYGHDTQTVQGRSVLYPAKKRLFEARNYVPKKTNGAEYCAYLLRQCTPAPVTVDGKFSIDENYVFERGDSYLDSVWGLLKKAGWCIQILEDGTIGIRKKPTTPSLQLDRYARSAIMPGIGYDYDRSEVPNRYIVVDPYDNYKTTVVTNTQAGSRTSYSARGGCWYDYVDEAPVHMDGESMKAYARRQLEYLSTVSKVYSYEREYVPGVYPFSVVNATLPEVDMYAELRVVSQSMTIDRTGGFLVTERAGYEIKEYTA